MSKIGDAWNNFSSSEAGKMIGAGAKSYISTINPILGNMIAGWDNAKAVEAKKGEVASWQNDVDNWYNKNYSQNFLDTSSGKAVLTQAQERLNNSNKVANNTTAVTGGTTESNLAAKTANNKVYGQTLNQLASMGTTRQDSIDSKYRYYNSQIMSEKLGLHDADIESAQTMQKNSGQLIGDAASMAMMFI